MLLQLIQILLVGGVSSVLAASENSFYFAFPALYGSMPTIHAGDTVNVTWLSTYDQTVLQLFCGGPSGVKVDERSGLEANGYSTFVVNTTWTSPCHWRIKPQDNSDVGFNSGTIIVTNTRATPATTWQPSDAVLTTCPASTSSASVSTISSIVSTTAAGDCSNKQALNTGASMGVGIIIGTALSGAAAAGWFALCIRRRRRGEREMKVVGPLHDHQAYYDGQHQQQALQNFQELHPFAIAEVEGNNGPRRDPHLAEMSSDSAQPNPTTGQ